MRRHSARNAAWSNQWKDCPAVTREMEVSGSCVSSAVACTAVRRLVVAAFASRMPSMSRLGSTATVRMPW